jgi:hypothetical protein
MPDYIGSKAISKVYLGAAQIAPHYLGDDHLFGSDPNSVPEKYIGDKKSGANYGSPPQSTFSKMYNYVTGRNKKEK